MHVCCGPCSTHAIEELSKEFDVTLFWSNSNIWPDEEYYKRISAAKRIAVIYDLPIIEDFYDHILWRAAIRGLEKEPEGRKRCAKCFEYNLGKTAEYAANDGYEAFTTTLTISPYKDSKLIFEIGERLGKKHGRKFLARDFKEDHGFDHSRKLSKEYDLYRQNYCGCEFSKRSMASPKE
ncbi:epoxyqueuosine reductase QueH [Thermoproteota archaeon]